jgi:hypothetical protein
MGLSSLEKPKPLPPSTYVIGKVPGQNLFQVANSATGRIHSFGTSREDALRQVRLLESLHFK